MAHSCGIRIGQRRFELVALDGSAKKHRVKRVITGDIPWDDDDPIGATTAALKQAFKGAKLKTDNVALSIDAGLAAFRNHTVHLEDKSKIEAVIKFEVESKLPQWDIDDVVVDFTTLDSTGVESHLLVTGVQKDDLWGPLTAATKAGVEPQRAEIEAVSVLNAAGRAGAFAADGAELLVHVGESSTSVILVDGGKLRSMRSLHIAGLVPTDVPPAPAEVADDDDEPVFADEPAASADTEVRLEEAAKRLRRELVRTVTGSQTANELRVVYVAGRRLPGLAGSDVLDVPVEELDVIPEEVETSDDAGDRGELAVAYGVALGALGGAMVNQDLRREELRFTGTFERLELPLAVFGLAAFALLFVQFIVMRQRINFREHDLQVWMTASNNFAIIGDTNRGVPGRMKSPPEALVEYAKRAQDGKDTQRTKFEQLQQIRNQLRNEVDALNKKLGRDGAVEQPQSALEATTLVLGVLSDLGKDQVGRFSIRQVMADFREGSGNKSDKVEVKLSMSFFGSGDQPSSNATGNFSAFMNELQSRDWCLEVVRPSTTVMETQEGIFADNIRIDVDVSKARGTT